MLLMDALDTKMTTVPYKGTGPAMTDLLGGVFDTMCDQTTNTIPQIGSNTIKGYAVTTSERIDVLPDLPTLQESGLDGFEMTVWHGLFAPAGTPPEILEKLSGALQTAIPESGVDILMGIGGTPEGVITAAAMRCLGGEIQGKLWPRDDVEREKAQEECDLERILNTETLCGGDNVFFTATGITSGELLEGVHYAGHLARTYSLLMRSKSGTVRHIESRHRLDRLQTFSQVTYVD
jgi:hypothetical protein